MFEGEQQVGHGVVQIILDEAHLLNITVKPENQGRGLGLANCWST
jgi:[ribosomal protein S18]-alanine N-acetyltransferase